MALVPMLGMISPKHLKRSRPPTAKEKLVAVTTGKRSDISARTRGRSIPASTIPRVHRLRAKAPT
jgi:hypothetical protein